MTVRPNLPESATTPPLLHHALGHDHSAFLLLARTRPVRSVRGPVFGALVPISAFRDSHAAIDAYLFLRVATALVECKFADPKAVIDGILLVSPCAC
jgi:hypothetical protein